MLKSLYHSPLRKQQCESNNIISSHSNADRSAVTLDTGNLIWIPDTIWEICQVLWGRMWWKSSFKGKKEYS